MASTIHIENLAASGRYHFSTIELAQIMGSSLIATRAVLRRLQQKGLIATPYRGFHLIVPPEYRSIKCLPADQFIDQLMKHLGLEYYIALLSAARFHGAAHQQPQMLQVMARHNRPGLDCGKVRVRFMARQNVEKIPTAVFNSPRGSVAVSSPEATAFDLIGYSTKAGGLDNVTTILVELSESISAKKLSAAAAFSPTPWAQRLGFLLDLVGAHKQADALAGHIAQSELRTVPLDPGSSSSQSDRDNRWKLLINIKVEPDL
jgi:predicted transcriptional regulator of viral defense system